MASTAGSHFGASLSYTELGPPDKIIPAGSSLRISPSVVVHGNIALNTCCSRTRRAINWVYCPPKSSTTIPPCSVFIFPCPIPCAFSRVVPCVIFAAPSIPSPRFNACHPACPERSRRDRSGPAFSFAPLFGAPGHAGEGPWQHLNDFNSRRDHLTIASSSPHHNIQQLILHIDHFTILFPARCPATPAFPCAS